MKTLLNIVILVCAALYVSCCTKVEDSNHAENSSLITISCSTPVSASTKTSIDVAAHTLKWVEDDQIGVAPVGCQFPGYEQNVESQRTGIAPYSIKNETISVDGKSARFEGPNQTKSTSIIAV